jgi:hypothetical protein
MSRLGIFVDRKTLASAEQLTALIHCRDVAEGMGHDVDFIFPRHGKANVRANHIRLKQNARLGSRAENRANIEFFVDSFDMVGVVIYDGHTVTILTKQIGDPRAHRARAENDNAHLR